MVLPEEPEEDEDEEEAGHQQLVHTHLTQLSFLYRESETNVSE